MSAHLSAICEFCLVYTSRPKHMPILRRLPEPAHTREINRHYLKWQASVLIATGRLSGKLVPASPEVHKSCPSYG